jgi:hypothetical protein
VPSAAHPSDPGQLRHAQNSGHLFLVGEAAALSCALHADQCSWINMVERWFATLREKQIRRGAHRSVRELEAAIKSYLEITDQSPRPFVWNKTADEILASVARFCAQTSESGH